MIGAATVPAVYRERRSEAAAPAPAPLLDSREPTAKGLGDALDAIKVDPKTNPMLKAGQHCAASAQFPGKATDRKGPCMLFPGKQVSAGGWCRAWAQKSRWRSRARLRRMRARCNERNATLSPRKPEDEISRHRIKRRIWEKLRAAAKPNQTFCPNRDAVIPDVEASADATDRLVSQQFGTEGTCAFAPPGNDLVELRRRPREHGKSLLVAT
jgi:hypothetical protein